MENYVAAVVGGKGGGGKSTVTPNLFFRVLKDDPTAILIDLDYPQHTSYKFFVERRQFNGLEPLRIIKMKPDDLNQVKILEIAKNHRTIILEYGKGVEESMKWVMSFADRLIMILQPTAYEHEAIGDIEYVYHKVGNKDISCSIIVNRVPKVVRYNNWIKTEPKPTYFKFSENFISELNCYSDSAGKGMSVLELKRTTEQIIKAYNEIELQHKELFK